MEKVLITGGAGFLGSYLCEFFVSKGHMVTAIDMSNGEKIQHLMKYKNFKFVQGSVLDDSSLEREIRRCDVLFHFAAIADPKRYVEEPLVTLDVDLRATLKALDFASQNNVKVAFASTSEIYGKNPNVPWKEDDDRVLGSTEINRWCYSSAKAVGEHYCYAYSLQEGLRFVIFRFFNVYGPRLDDLGHGRVIPKFLESFLLNESVIIHGDGKQSRTFLYVDDAIDAIVKLTFCKDAENQAFNIGSTREINILELAKLMKKIGGFHSPIKFLPHKEVYGESYEDIPRRLPDVSKIKRVIGWEACTSYEEGLKKTIDYYRKRTRL